MERAVKGRSCLNVRDGAKHGGGPFRSTTLPRKTRVVGVCGFVFSSASARRRSKAFLGFSLFFAKFRSKISTK